MCCVFVFHLVLLLPSLGLARTESSMRRMSLWIMCVVLCLVAPVPSRASCCCWQSPLAFAVAETSILVRVGHQFGVGEDATLSQPVNVDLFALLSMYTITGVSEASLTANQLASNVQRLQWNTVRIGGRVGSVGVGTGLSSQSHSFPPPYRPIRSNVPHCPF